jgi:hypothetical protein
MNPSTIEEAILDLIYIFNKEGIKITHRRGFGMDIRNNWGLWDEQSDLHKELKSIGIWHADDMYDFLVKCAIKDIEGKPRKQDELVEYYKRYWENTNSYYQQNSSEAE